MMKEKSTEIHMKFSIFVSPFQNGPQIIWALLWWQGFEQVTKDPGVISLDCMLATGG